MTSLDDARRAALAWTARNIKAEHTMAATAATVTPAAELVSVPAARLARGRPVGTRVHQEILRNTRASFDAAIAAVPAPPTDPVAPASSDAAVPQLPAADQDVVDQVLRGKHPKEDKAHKKARCMAAEIIEDLHSSSRTQLLLDICRDVS